MTVHYAGEYKCDYTRLFKHYTKFAQYRNGLTVTYIGKLTIFEKEQILACFHSFGLFSVLTPKLNIIYRIRAKVLIESLKIKLGILSVPEVVLFSISIISNSVFGLTMISIFHRPTVITVRQMTVPEHLVTQYS